MRQIEATSNLIQLGKQGENEALEVTFDVSDWPSLYGDGDFTLLVKRNGDKSAYPAVTSYADGSVVWTVSDVDTASAGFGEAELVYIVNDVVAKSVTFNFIVKPSLTTHAKEEPKTEPYEAWMARVLQAAIEAAQSAQAADADANRAEEAAEDATDAASSILDMTVSAATLPAGDPASVEKTKQGDVFNLEFGIPRGEKGEKGDTGSQGPQGEKGDPGNYTKPEGGIPYSDLSAGVQDSLDKADTAYQLPSDGIPKTDINPTVYASIPVIQANRDEGSRFTANTSGLALTTGTIVAIVFDNPVGTSSANVILTDNILGTTTRAFLRLIDITGQGRAINPPADWFLANRPYLFQYDYRGGENRYLICVTPRVTANVVQGTMEISQGGTGATTASQARDNLGVAEKPAVKTTMDSIATVNTQYYLGLTDSVTIRLPTDAVAGDNIKCVFYSGTTITSLYITGASYISDEIAINENERIELNMLYDGEYWAIVSNAIPTPDVIAQGYCGDTSTGGDGKNLEWILTENNVLSIRGIGRMENSPSSSSLWSGYEGLIHKVNMNRGITSIGSRAFLSCTSLTNATIPDSVTSIGEWAFYYCLSLTNATIPDSVTSIGGAAFHTCHGLTSVIIPDSVTSIGGQAFYNCINLMSVTVGSGMTSIGDYTFKGCKKLASVTISKSVTSIGYEAFQNCTSLTDVYYGGTEAEWNSITFGQGNENLTNATIHFNS